VSGENDSTAPGVSPKRVLVTGATGFVGGAVAAEFEAAGHTVTGTSTSGDGSLLALSFGACHGSRSGADPDSGDAERISGLARPGGSTRISEVLEQVRPEVIIHLAGVQSVPESWRDPRRVFEVNTGGTAALLREAGRLVPDAHFVLASSAAVYGNLPASQPGEAAARPARPFEESDPMKPGSPYGASKAAAEVLALEAAATTGMPVTIARLFNQVGPGQPEAQVPAEFAAAIAAAEISGDSSVGLEVGNPAVERDYSDTRDTARAIRLAVEHGVTGRLNFCTGRTRSLARIIDLLAGLSRIRVEVRQDPSRSNPNDAAVFGGSAARLRQSTGWRPEVEIGRSLAGLLEAQRERLSGPGR
jgi:GDP-4-dehydro-6-deoxy-D-mannose reductase